MGKCNGKHIYELYPNHKGERWRLCDGSLIIVPDGPNKQFLFAETGNAVVFTPNNMLNLAYPESATPLYAVASDFYFEHIVCQPAYDGRHLKERLFDLLVDIYNQAINDSAAELKSRLMSTEIITKLKKEKKHD